MRLEFLPSPPVPALQILWRFIKHKSQMCIVLELHLQLPTLQPFLAFLFVCACPYVRVLWRWFFKVFLKNDQLQLFQPSLRPPSRTSLKGIDLKPFKSHWQNKREGEGRIILHHARRKMTGVKQKINEGKVKRIHKIIKQEDPA